jgi:N6-L-threonylcarbamoyladenine synthase
VPAFFGYYKILMTILGIETSCDETSAAVIREGQVLSNATVVQLLHAPHGGVVPELASRAHLQLIVPIVQESLRKGGITRTEIDAVAAVYGPGLVGALLVGLTFGKALALSLGKPFVGVNHMEAHVFSNLLSNDRPQLPFVNLTVSGGHTQLVLVRDLFDYEILGETRDDAAGEAFDKVAKMLGVGYPGGPLIDKLASNGNPKFVEFPRPYMEHDPFAFSFSGIKTSMLYHLKRIGYDKTKTDLEGSLVADLAASFQAAVVDVLIAKLLNAAVSCGVKDITVAGGVSANSELRRRLEMEARIRHLRLFIPKFEYCTDNAAMVAMVGYEKLRRGLSSDLELTAEPSLMLTLNQRDRR